ncbi:MAG: serine/threonine protein kinase [Verrucomicrobiales bacterium]|nr:serine/threonine protein kinase [Verrucomicrobiales bacterium]
MRILALCSFVSISLMAENWPGWRGPRGDGTSLEKGVPVKWSATENVAWKMKVPGRGHSSPVIWGDRVLLASCLPEKEQRILLCLDRRTGRELWRRVVVKSGLETLHRLNSRASGTPATDGKLIFATFMKIDGRKVPAPNVGAARLITPGTIVVAAFDMDGRQKWNVEIGEFISAHGFNSCPVIYEDLVIINGDHDGKSYMAALDRETGKVRWKVKREHGIRSYGTPIIRKVGGRNQMVLAGSKAVTSYDPDTGRQHWTVDGPTEQFVASMVFDGSHFFVTGGFPERHILAIRPDGKGNVTETHIAWRARRGASYVPSPIVVGKYFLVVADSGVASCFLAKTGERLWMERLGGGHSASTISAGGLVYFVSDKGVTSVVKPGPKFEVMAKNEIGELVSSSPAISQGQIFIRGEKHLFCVGR